MGGRAGGGASGGMGSRSVSGVDKYGRQQTYSLKGELASYKEAYSKVEKEFGAAMKEQAKGMSTEQLQKYLPKAGQAVGEKAVVKAWKENMQKYKGGDYDIGLLSHSTSDWGKGWMKDTAQFALQAKVIQGELNSRK